MHLQLRSHTMRFTRLASYAWALCLASFGIARYGAEYFNVPAGVTAALTASTQFWFATAFLLSSSAVGVVAFGRAARA